MISFVIVSHSQKLAEGVVELASQVKAETCKIVAAAGVNNPENPIGTDAIKIMQAVEEVFSPDGTIIFVDLGSAILSAETALDLLSSTMAKKVKICYAPLVEGTLSAVVAASAGDSMEAVLAEANSAADVKLSMSI
ncbi:dihydroxyacetone kinase phosphoryl donor subunit DhaM [Phocoenobacter skyensis]|uniref:phosphoenolpyruvate--glycerone phosphotransferase n=1 Tax=Phocoenobacter skyensis TaxID=97481 RepID=A0A1H7X0T5_9PAST|nr:dihydroxyacetone kinase phosphoryl donor subunit DhaM [Pasteurella skyensis]MDP8079271.1 dihydroxyacetone kinase phosphoryl donor subunit DhaM [Pasteurella skyensis]MDP8085508.1 dihydroxyacetone kinase phosphoryl donor subunit DhaM [Pasteurella skyensis]MDP8170481.1 dihydroxyacetone kinase phosphoryl donor subunit DhaM [Pasteurella skyensis]MDP8174557.1 dihydroxyacetone kinase phosphoryl donor subunit DhaM [Pasteurella skyensis]MDP8185137.1 dihydroxyacetone kinase phosphoryl donor subunit D